MSTPAGTDLTATDAAELGRATSGRTTFVMGTAWVVGGTSSTEAFCTWATASRTADS